MKKLLVLLVAVLLVGCSGTSARTPEASQASATSRATTTTQTPTTTLAQSDVEGTWVLEAFDSHRRHHDVEVGVNAPRTPWIQIGDDISGTGGCNQFAETSFRLEGDELILIDRGFWTAMACGLGIPLPPPQFGPPDSPGSTDTTVSYDRVNHDPNGAERVLQGIFRADRIRVSVDGSSMTWAANGVTLFFRSVDQPPPS